MTTATTRTWRLARIAAQLLHGLIALAITILLGLLLMQGHTHPTPLHTTTPAAPAEQPTIVPSHRD